MAAAAVGIVGVVIGGDGDNAAESCNGSGHGGAELRVDVQPARSGRGRVVCSLLQVTASTAQERRIAS